MKNVFAIGAERDGTLRHAQCAILILGSLGGTVAVASLIFGTRRGESLQVSMARVSALFLPRSKMQKQKPRRKNDCDQIEPAGVIPNDVRVLHRARRPQPVGN